MTVHLLHPVPGPPGAASLSVCRVGCETLAVPTVPSVTAALRVPPALCTRSLYRVCSTGVSENSHRSSHSLRSAKLGPLEQSDAGTAALFLRAPVGLNTHLCTPPGSWEFPRGHGLAPWTRSSYVFLSPSRKDAGRCPCRALSLQLGRNWPGWRGVWK